MALARLIVLLLVLSVPGIRGVARASCVEGAVLRQSSNTVAPGEIADHVGFCENHASRDLLHQAICKFARSPADCFQPAELDFLDFDAGSDPERRNSEQALREILERGTASRESCLKFEDLFKPLATQTFTTYDDKYAAATHDVIVGECVRERERAPSLTSVSGDLDACLVQAGKPETTEQHRQIVNACEVLNVSGERGRYLYKAVRERKHALSCPEAHFPSLLLRTEKFAAADTAGTSARLNGLLDKGNQVEVVTGSPHALVVSNYRLICARGREELQYQTLDSLYDTRWSTAKRAGDWIDGTALVRQLEPGTFLSWLDRQHFREPRVQFKIPTKTGDPATLYGVADGSPEYRAGLRNGMNYSDMTVDQKTGVVTVWVRRDDGTRIAHTFPAERVPGDSF